MKRILAISLLILLVQSSMLHAQDWSVSLLISGIASQPTGDYGEELGDDAKLTRRYGFDIGNDIGLAKTGLGVGIELYSPDYRRIRLDF